MSLFNIYTLRLVEQSHYIIIRQTIHFQRMLKGASIRKLVLGDFKKIFSSTTYTIDRLKPTSFSKKSKKRLGFIKKSFIVVTNVAIVVTIVALTTTKSNPTSARDLIVDDSQTTASPLDDVSSSDIAVSVAKLTDLPEASYVIDAADSAKLQIDAIVVEKDIVEKPQVITSTVKTIDDVVEHTVIQGEKVSDLASKYGVSSDSIKWSNDLTTDTLTAGKILEIPPANGILYTIKDGDTIDRLAETYKSSKEQIIAFNDAEIRGVTVGQKVFIPGGQKPAPRVYANNNTSSRSFFATYGGNTYSYGYCTYYAAARTGAPNGWGNANTWAIGARQTPGWVVSKTPVVGAIAQTTAMSYWGHVAVVEDVSADGTQIKISDMNNLAGWGRVGYSDWIPTGSYQWYIYR